MDFVGVVRSNGGAAAVASGGRPEGPPDPEVAAKASRRRFSANYKVSLLDEIDRDPSKAGTILRREGLYSSHVANWRKQRHHGTLAALSKKRGKKGKSAVEVENEKLRRDVARLERELEKAEVIIGAQKKLAEILGVDLPKIAGKDESK
jgi:hypothetical protein